MKIHTCGFARKVTARERLEKEIKNYLPETKYKTYEIKETIRKWLPFVHYKFLVELKKRNHETRRYQQLPHRAFYTYSW